MHGDHASSRSDRAFLGHPRGLGFLGFAEGWERFSYYGMQTLLVLYMTRQLLLPGHVERIAGFPAFRRVLEWAYGGGHTLTTIALSSAIFGTYTLFVYATPIAGGIIADRWLGTTRTITVGALLMAAGHFLMAFDVTFLLALLLLVLGVGCFKGNIASQVGALYAPDDLRRADAFQIFLLFVNAAVIIAPLVTGTLGEELGWHYGFGAAGVGMVIGLVTYLAGRASLPPELPRAAPAAAPSPGAAKPASALTSRDDKALAVLVLLVPVLACGAVGNQEIFNANLLWIPDHVDLVFFGRTMPTSWLITLDAVVSVSSLIAAVVFWRVWSLRFREPSEVWKLTLGMAISALAQLCMYGAALASANGHKTGLGWVMGFEVLNSIGFANVFPVGLALFARAAPKAVAGMVIGLYYLHLAAANYLVGLLGGLLDKLPGDQFWLLHATIIGASAVAMLLAARFAGHLLEGESTGAA